MKRAFIPSIAISLAISLMVRAEDWPTPRHDVNRSGRTTEQLPLTKLGQSWQWKSTQPPLTAWTAPARWDAYAYIRGLRAMRNYDAVFHPIVVGERLYFGSSVDDSIHCLNLKSGKEIWRFTTDAPIRVAPCHVKGKLYFGSDDGHAYCISANDGKLQWRFKPSGKERRILNNGRLISMWPCRSGVVVDKDVAYCAFSMLPWHESYLCAIHAQTGKPVFSRKFKSGYTLEGALALTDSLIVSAQGRVQPTLFRRSDGAPLGSLRDGGGGSFLSLLDGKKIVHGPGNKRGWLTMTDVGSRKRLATYDTKTAAVSDGKRIYLLSDTKLEALSADRNRRIWEVPCSCPHDIILSGDLLFVGGNDEVAAYRCDDGKEVWRAAVRGRVHGLVIANGSLLVATDEGIIQCFQSGFQLSKPKSIVTRKTPPAPVVQVKDRDLIGRWLFRQGMSERFRRRGVRNHAQIVPDLAGRNHGTIQGKVTLRRVGSVETLELDGSSHSISITNDHKKMSLPTKEISVEAWVRVDKPMTWGGILGAIQDNGDFERGWLLGFRGKRFCFAVKAKNGPGRLTYLNSEKEFKPGEWYHVVGTYDGVSQRVYVNGKLAASSKEQKGEIHYPPRAFVEMGSYRDDNEFYRTTGMLHEVRLYRRALRSDEIAKHHQAKVRQFPIPIHLEMGPYAQFIDSESAVVRWRTAKPSATLLRHGYGGLTETIKDAKLKTEHAVTIRGLRRNRIYLYRVETPGGQTPRFELDTHFNYTVPPIHVENVKPSARVSKALRSLRGSKGICILLGGDASTALQIAKESQLRVIVLDEDEKRVEQARASLFRSGVYGWRVVVHHVESLSTTPMVSNIADLTLSSVKHAKEAERVTRPGGVLMTGEELTTKAMSKNAGEWSHLYGRADNSAFGGESLGGAKSATDLKVQWLGRPGPRAQPDRSGRKPSPLSVNGRLFVQGLHRMIALNAYNGTPLWSMEVSRLERFNMPRDCGNWCADKDHVFAAIGKRCWQLDAETGKMVKLHEVTPGRRKEWDHDWSFVARVNGKLIGTAVKKGTAFTNYWGNANQGWYDSRTGPATYKVCSENLFVRDASTGKQTWQWSKGLILNSTITVTDDRVYFVECRHAKVQASTSRRVGMPELWKDQHLVALDLSTGKKIYEKPIDTVDGIVVFYLAHSQGRLILASSSINRYDVYAIEALDGKSLWHQHFRWPGNKGDHGKAMSRPAIVDNRVFVRPGVMDLSTGKLLNVKMPSGGCGTYSMTRDLCIFRSGNITVWNPDANRQTSWSRLRPGCWLSTIPAGGMLLSPEAGGGCSCGSWMETSIGFAPKK